MGDAMSKARRHSKRRERRQARAAKMDPAIAHAICDDLPDGTYFAMMEEMTGLEPVDVVMAPGCEEEESQGTIP